MKIGDFETAGIALYSAKAVPHGKTAELRELVKEISAKSFEEVRNDEIRNVSTIEAAPGRRDEILPPLVAHKAHCLEDEPGTLQFEILLPKNDDTKILLYEVYRDAAAFEVHRNGPSWRPAGMVAKLYGARCTPLE